MSLKFSKLESFTRVHCLVTNSNEHKIPKNRVSQGGHNIPEDIIRRRFKAGLDNFHSHYSKIVNSWAFYDSSGLHPKLID